jgi:D-tyrosyl-tRNA(Tyr) deacylase
MKAVIQRVHHAAVSVDGDCIGRVGPGLLVYVGVTEGDTPAGAQWLAGKVARLRIFNDDEGKLNRSVLDIGGGVLVISNFTLYGDGRKGNRPSYVAAAGPDLAEPLYEAFADAVAAEGIATACGVFGAHMDIEALADGPVNIILETPDAMTDTPT